MIFTTKRATTQGFTAVELLVTLFVAAAFLIAGYQLFNVVIKDGGATRTEAEASNVAYQYLRRYATAATNPCTPRTPVASEPASLQGANNATVSATITCPQSDAPTVSQLEVTVSYGAGTDANTVKFATFIDGSQGASPVVEVTNGMIGWWQLNGNGNSSSGALNGVPSGTSSTTGQNGQGSSALLFNGSSSQVRVPMTNMAKPTNAFTVTGWFKADTLTTAGDRSIASTTEAGGWALYLSSSCSNGMLRFQAYTAGAYRPVCSAAGSITTNTGYFGAGVYNGSSVTLYLQGVNVGSAAASGAMTWPAGASVPLCIGSEASTSTCTGNWFDGSLDDVRFYNRALSASEILQLYNGGAQ
jgi:Tfp pilus assembly protein PilE